MVLEEVDRRALGLGEHRDEDVGSLDLALAGALDVQQGPVDDPPEPDRLVRLVLPPLGDLLEAGEHLVQLPLQPIEIPSARLEDRGRTGIVEQGEQHVLQGEELVAVFLGVLEGSGQRDAQVLTQHYSGSMVHCSGKPASRAKDWTVAMISECRSSASSRGSGTRSRG